VIVVIILIWFRRRYEFLVLIIFVIRLFTGAANGIVADDYTVNIGRVESRLAILL